MGDHGHIKENVACRDVTLPRSTRSNDPAILDRLRQLSKTYGIRIPYANVLEE